MNYKQLQHKLFMQKYGKAIYNIQYFGICLLGGAIGAVIVFTIFDLLLILQNKGQ